MLNCASSKVPDFFKNRNLIKLIYKEMIYFFVQKNRVRVCVCVCGFGLKAIQFIVCCPASIIIILCECGLTAIQFIWCCPSSIHFIQLTFNVTCLNITVKLVVFSGFLCFFFLQKVSFLKNYCGAKTWYISYPFTLTNVHMKLI